MPPYTQPKRDSVGKLLRYLRRSRLAVGDRLPPIRTLAGQLGIPSHAARDAVLQAQTIGVVQVRPRSGVFVQSVDFSSLVGAFERALPQAMTESDANLLDLLEARRVVEAEMVAAAAARRRLADLVPVKSALDAMYADPSDYAAYVRHNEDFHLRAAEIAGNKVLVVVLRHLLHLLRAVLVERQPGNWRDDGSMKREVDAREHEAIYAALLAGDPSAARAAVLVHLRDTTDSLVPAGRAGQG
jgi:GntR family transcriptional repressor for pyruvate dehydrogenase complex